MSRFLFGGDKPWDVSQFTSSDDRVRGGKSQSYLTAEGGETAAPRAEFHGHLDITALGGAGFASQRTADGFPGWDLSGHDALVVDVARGDGRKYTVTLKDEVLPRRPDGREQSTVSWEYDFVAYVGGRGAGANADASHRRVVIPFGEFKPTYRGKPKPDAEPLDLANVKRFSFMMRSFFGEQEGDFSLHLNSVSAEKIEETRGHSVDSVADAKLARDTSGEKSNDQSKGFASWISRLCGSRR